MKKGENKMKKKLVSLMMVALLVLMLFTACGGSAESGAYDNGMGMVQEAKPEAPAEGIGDMVTGSASTSNISTEQKLIKRVHIDAETEDLEALLPQLTDQIAVLGGYIESQELYNGSKSSYRSRSLSMTVRIPAERLSEFTGQVEGLANVVSYTESADDVTLQYIDTESRVKALEVEQERLLELLAEAKTMADLLEIESRLTDVRYQLESYASQLRSLQNKVSYATVNLYIDQVKVYTEVEPQTVWQRISSGFSENLTDIGEGLTDFFVWATVYSPQIIFWLIVIVVAITLLRRLDRRPGAARKAAKKETETDQKDA